MNLSTLHAQNSFGVFITPRKLQVGYQGTWPPNGGREWMWEYLGHWLAEPVAEQQRTGDLMTPHDRTKRQPLRLSAPNRFDPWEHSCFPLPLIVFSSFRHCFMEGNDHIRLDRTVMPLYFELRMTPVQADACRCR